MRMGTVIGRVTLSVRHPSFRGERLLYGELEYRGTLTKNGLRNLETLVVMDIFETETAGCDRRPDGVTYLLPSSAFVEEEGSVTNSGRLIQWRYKAANPQGGSKSDTEVLLRVAKAAANTGASVTTKRSSPTSTRAERYRSEVASVNSLAIMLAMV